MSSVADRAVYWKRVLEEALKTENIDEVLTRAEIENLAVRLAEAADAAPVPDSLTDAMKKVSDSVKAMEAAMKKKPTMTGISISGGGSFSGSGTPWSGPATGGVLTSGTRPGTSVSAALPNITITNHADLNAKDLADAIIKSNRARRLQQ